MTEFDISQILCDHVNATGIPDHYDFVSELFRLDVNMKRRTIGIYD